MPQVFVSYARADKRRVAKLVRALRDAGFEPWWDDDIPAGASWEQTIEKALAAAQAVIVCWSPVSVASENVRSEARVARARGRLVQIFLEPCDPPLFFGERQGIDLGGWNGSARNAAIGRVKRALDRAIAGETLDDPLASQRQTGRRIQPRIAVAILTALAVIVLGGWWWANSAASAAPSRVAVQPIKTLGADASVADSLTDQITTSLNDGHIPTISRTDSESLSEGDADKKLRSLGIGYIVNGTIERSGENLHARLHLDDRIRHESLWSYEATGTADDPTTLNSSIARSIAGVISCAYRALGPGGLNDTELLSRYLRVCDLFVNHDDAADFKSTFELFDDLRLIMAKAPNFAPAFSDFAKFGAYLAPLLPSDQAAGVRAEAARAAKRALELDPHAADAYVAQEMLLAPTDWAHRETLLRKAVSVDPKWPHSNGFLAMLLTETGRMRESAIYAQRAAAADLQIDWKPFGAKMACDAMQTDGPIAELRQRLSNAPADTDSNWALRWCLLDAGKVREAQTMDPPSADPALGELRAAAEKALSSGSSADRERVRQIGSKLPTDASTARFVIPWSAAAGDVDTAFRFAETQSPGYPTTGIIDFLFIPQTESMRRDPRFFGLAKRYGLAQFWTATGRWPDFCAGPKLSACRSAIAMASRAQRPPSTGS
ncbi:MAG: TIR domain-containing protein [Sphingomicrobium sp.]